MTAQVESNEPQNGIMRVITHVLNVIVAVAMLGLMFVTFADVVGRYFFSRPLNGSVDIIQMIMGIVIFSALPLTSVRQEHITVDLFDGVFSERGKKVRQIVVTAISAGVVGFISLRMFSSAQYMRSHNQVGFILDVPIAPVVYAMSAMALLAFVLLAHLCLRFVSAFRAGGATPQGKGRA